MRQPRSASVAGTTLPASESECPAGRGAERHPKQAEIDSIRVLALPDGRPVKCIEYDSFGNVAIDTKPEWRFPLGFACGLNDHYTGFVRFGFRDYDPRFGRFTAGDPLGDTGGDHDLWEYCVDDPVSMNDPSGLEGETVSDEYGWFRKNIGWWTLPHEHPEFKKRSASLSRSMKKELGEFGTGVLRIDELTPSIASLALQTIPGYKREKVHAKKRY